MATTRIRIDGLAALGQRLKELKADLQLKTARSATAAGAAIIKKRAKQLAPIAPAPYRVDDGSKDGQLVQPENIGRNIITKRVPKAQTQLTSEHLVAVRGKRKYGYANRIGILQEFGNVNQSPQPFLRPAFEEKKGEAVQAIKARLLRRIEQAEKGGSK